MNAVELFSLPCQPRTFVKLLGLTFQLKLSKSASKQQSLETIETQ